MYRWYNFRSFRKRDLQMSRSRPRLAWLCRLVILAAGAAAPVAGAQTWTQPARELSAAIQSHVQTRGGIVLTVRNLSSMETSDFTEARRAIESQLRALGMRVVPAEQAVEVVEVTLSESSSSYLWVAQIGRTEPREVVMLPVAIPAQTQAGAAMEVLRRTPLVTEPVRILDAATVSHSGSSALVVLDAEGIKVYRLQTGRWTLEAAQALVTPPLPRDLRGRLVAQDANLTVYLPGALCAGQWTPAITMTCRASDDPWPLVMPGGEGARAGFNAARNYFTGAMLPPLGDGKTAFYSATRLTLPENLNAWLLEGIDGTVRLMNTSGQTVATIAGWGSLAGVSSTCANTPYVLATRASSVEQPDAVRAYRLSGGKPVEVSEPLEFAGPVTELWTQADGTSALAVSKNLKTGDYEASSLALACGR